MKEITGYSTASYWINGEEIAANEEQQKILAQMIDIDCEPPEDEKLHALWHSAPEYEKGMGGYEYGEMLKKWAADKPQVKIFHFDDCMFMGSVGFIIPSASKYEHMGLNVILCPQAGKVVDFFLYPSHQNSLLEALTSAMEENGKLPRIDPNKPSTLKKEKLGKTLLGIQ
jgi:hypothetical protein